MLAVDWNVALRYASLVAIAYSVDPSADYNPATIATIKTAGFSYLHTIYGDELATDINPNIGKIDSFGFLASSDQGELVAIIRGTVTIMDWVHDAAFLMLPCPIGHGTGLTEDGFTSVYRSLRIGRSNSDPSLREAVSAIFSQGGITTVTVAGHSLGGALAHLLGLDVAFNTPCRDPQVYTYASPRVGDHIFASIYNSSVPHTYRIVNRQDVVPQLPPILPLPYEHVNTKYELNPPPGKVAGTILCMHQLATYLWLMDQLAGNNTWQLTKGCQPRAPTTEAAFGAAGSTAVAG